MWDSLDQQLFAERSNAKGKRNGLETMVCFRTVASSLSQKQLIVYHIFSLIEQILCQWSTVHWFSKANQYEYTVTGHQMINAT